MSLEMLSIGLKNDLKHLLKNLFSGAEANLSKM